MKILIVAVIVCLAIAWAVPAQDGGMGTLAGVVLNAKGKAVAGASVTMENASGGSPHATITNAQGQFFFPQLLHGYYDVRATHSGQVSEWKHNVEVNTGKQTNVTLRLHAQKRAA